MKKIDLFKTILISFLLSGGVLLFLKEDIFPNNYKLILVISFALLSFISSYIPKKKEKQKELYFLSSSLIVLFTGLLKIDIFTHSVIILGTLLILSIINHFRFKGKYNLYYIVFSLTTFMITFLFRIGFVIPEVLILLIILYEALSTSKNKKSKELLELMRALTCLVFLLTFITVNNIFYLLFLSIYFISLVYFKVIFKNDNDYNYFYPFLLIILFIPVLFYSTDNLYFVILTLIFISILNYMLSIILRKKRYIKASLFQVEAMFILSLIATVNMGVYKTLFISVISFMFTVINKHDRNLLLPIKTTFLTLPLMQLSLDNTNLMFESVLLVNLVFYLILYLTHDDKIKKDINLYTLILFIFVSFLLGERISSFITPVIILLISTIIYLDIKDKDKVHELIKNIIYAVIIYLSFAMFNKLTFKKIDTMMVFSNLLIPVIYLLLAFYVKDQKSKRFYLLATTIPIINIIGKINNINLIPLSVFILVYGLLNLLDIKKTDIYVLIIVFFLNFLLYSQIDYLVVIGLSILGIFFILGLFSFKEELLISIYMMIFFILYRFIFKNGEEQIMILSLTALTGYFLVNSLQEKLGQNEQI